MSVAKFLGAPLPALEAKKLNQKFKSRYPRPAVGNKWKDFGNSISFRIDQLENFINNSKKALSDAGVDPDEWGVSLYFLINETEIGRSGHRKDKPSVMLVTSSFTEDGNGKVTRIHNKLERILPLPDSHEDNKKTEPDDYDHELNFFDFGDRHP